MKSEIQDNLFSQLKNHIISTPVTGELPDDYQGMILGGCVSIVQKTGDKVLLDHLERYAAAIIDRCSHEGDHFKQQFENGKADFYIGTIAAFLFDVTGDGKYKDFASSLYEKLTLYLQSEHDEGNAVNVSRLHAYMPFYTDYETRWNKKNGYNDICDRFKSAFELIRSDDGKISLSDKILFLKSVIDSLNLISIQIYEDYRLLEDILRQGIKDLFFKKEDFDKILDLDDTDKLIAAYVLLTSIDKGHIALEKYRSLAVELLNVNDKDILYLIDKYFADAVLV